MAGGAQMGGMGGAAGAAGGLEGNAAGGFQLSQMMQNIPDEKLMQLAQTVNPDAVQAALQSQDGQGFNLNGARDMGFQPPQDLGNVLMPQSQAQAPRTPSLTPQALNSLSQLSASQSQPQRTPQAGAVAPASGRQVDLRAGGFVRPTQPVQQRGGLAQILGRR